MKRSNLIVLVFVALLSACQALVPYDSEFACTANQDYGRCMDVQSAYEDARANEAIPVGPRPGEKFKPGKQAPTHQAPDTAPLEQRGALLREVLTPTDSATRLREARYREIAGLIENPVTPLVRAPKVLRTLILSYSGEDTLYMPRFVYSIAEDAQFVLGDYLEAAPTERTVYPNGTPMAQWSAP